ncbi:MAG: GNAT family protein [Ignavibacteriaceae bacterium]|jgi:GNAT superfamily N-acetyltransferase
MGIKKFSETTEGTIYKSLLYAYSEFPELTDFFKDSWLNFDKFIYNNLSFMDYNGFITVDNKIDGNFVIGFMSWDPRKLPISVEIGHNCIIKNYQGKGYGKKQLLIGLDMIKNMKPFRIIVKTGKVDFFKPAQHIYTSAGFKFKSVIKRDNLVVPEVIEYEFIPDSILLL